MKKRLTLFALTLVLWGLGSTTAYTQAVFGSIFGTVTDPQGAAVAGAKVTVTDVRKGTSDVTTTNDTGNYSVTHLIPDLYSVRIEAPGFKAFEQKEISVSADRSARLDAQFQVGSANETVEVSGEAPQLQTDRADVAVQFNERYVENLPVFNRNFTQFELMSPGTQKLVGWSHAATENPQGSQQIFVNGQHFSGTAYELDGTDNQDPILGIIVVNPNLDAVTETKISLQAYDAEMGKAVAGYVTAQTKSGSNEFHGSGFWFRRSDANQARDPFTQYAPDPTTGRFLPRSRWQQFGGAIGGPIIKDKLFFFGDYQGTRQTVGVTNLLTVPTARVLSTCTAPTGNCDLSQYLGTVNSGNGQAYNPNTGNLLTGEGRDPFPNNQIPVSMLSPQAVNILKLFPQPQNDQIYGNYVASGSGPFNQNSFDTRIDWAATQTIQVFGRFSLDYFNLSGQPSLGALGGIGTGLGPGLAGSSITHNYSLSSGVTKTFSPTLLADFRFGWFRYNPQTHKWDEGTTPATTFGIPGLNTGTVATSGLPYFDLGGNGQQGNQTISDFGDGLGVARCNCPLTEKEDQFQWVTNWTKTLGNHQVKFGADIRYAKNLRIPSDQNRSGELQFHPQGTSDAGSNGLALATFLLGDVGHFDRYVSSSLNAAERQKRWFFYGQDTYRVTPKLTLNYGLRWEIYFPETVNAKGNGGFASLETGFIRVGGYGGFGLNGNVGNNLHSFAPRIGIAYSLNDRTVVRLGYGRSYDMGVFGSNFGHAVTQNLPVLISQITTASSVNPGASNDIVPAFTLAQGPPPVVFPAIPSNGLIPLQGPNGDVNTRIRPLHQTLPVIDAWNVTVQRQLTASTTLELAYVGNRGQHGFAGDGATYNVNQPYAGPLSVPTAQRRPLYNRYSYPGYIDPTTGGTLLCCSQDLSNYFGNDANSNYNSLQVKVEKRFTNGFQLLSHYTWSRALHYDNNYFVDNPAIAYGPDDQNRQHVWVMNLVYDLPFGKGKMFAGGVGRAMDLVIGGWQVTSTTNWSSGLPWTPSFSNCGPEIDSSAPCRPSKGTGSFGVGAGSFDPITHSVRLFTPQLVGTNWADPGPGNVGNSGFDSLYGPRYFGTDASVMKNFSVTERVKAQFRMDVFNLFNHPILGFANTQNFGNNCVAYTATTSCGTGGLIKDIQDGTNMRELQFAIRLSF